ncbi:MAG: SDR family NAD(P)-dependent oxidoreductase [Nannocystaceae bacterium]
MAHRDLVTAVLRAAAVGGGSLFCRFLEDGEIDGPRTERTFDEFVGRCLRLAAGIQAAGGRGERVLLLYPPGADFAEGFVACVLAGAIAVPVPPPDPRRLERTLSRLTRIAVDADIRFVLAPAELCAMVPAMAELAPELARRPWIAAESCAASGARWADPDASASSLAYLQYTSGSTGDPKGVRVTHGNLIHNTEGITYAFGAHAGSAATLWLPPHHDMGLIGGILEPLLNVFPMTWMSPIDFLRRPARWLRAVSGARATISGGPDFAYALCARKVTDDELEGVDLSSWELAFSGAEPVRAATLEAFARRFEAHGFAARALYPTYGLAESTLIVSGGRPGAGWRTLELDADALGRGEVRAGAGRTLVSCGPPLPGVEVAIVDPSTGAETDEVGEIWLAGPDVADGYWANLEATRDAFAARTAGGRGPFLRTGDLGLVRDGELYVVGRLKDVVIVRGRNIHPADVEAAIAAAHPAIRPGGVAVFRIELGGEERAAAAVEVDERRAGDRAAVIEAIRGAAAQAAEVGLAAVTLLPAGALPKTTSGKIQRFAARELASRDDAPALARWVEATREVGPRAIDGVRRRLIATIAPRLGVAPERLDGQRSFDAYGLDSAGLVELSEAVERAFGRPIPASALFNHPNLDALARFLATSEGPRAADEAAASEAPRAADDPAPIDEASAPAAARYDTEGEALARLDRRSLAYRFDLEAEMPWERLGEPGCHVPEPLAITLGIDAATLRSTPGAWALAQWGMALEFCVGFEALERLLIGVCVGIQATAGASKSLQLLIEEEDKHIALFRRYARWLRDARPDDAARFDALESSWSRRRGAGWLALEGAEDHLRSWLWTLTFEAWTVYLHEALVRSPEPVQPAWLAAHALHRREEAQHLATDLAFVDALALADDARRRVVARFLLELLEAWPDFFAVSAVHGLCRARFPGIDLQSPDPAICARQLLAERAFTSLHRAAPGLAELLARPADEVRAAAAAVARGEALPSPERKERIAVEAPQGPFIVDPEGASATKRAPATDAAMESTARAADGDDTSAIARPPVDDDAVAIVGFGCRFPGDVASLDDLWERLVAGVDAITEVPPNRWDIDAYYDPDPRAPSRMYTRWGGFLPGIEDFDAAFFGISPREARTMDPQQRLLLEVSWEALEHAGIPPSSLAGTPAGVWIGICSWDYSRRNHDALHDSWSATGNALSVAAGRISYTLGLRGPSMAVDTACSSSMVAIHLAVQSLRRGESDLALCGGVNLLLSPLSTICFSALRAMSPVGRCKSFDASADGYVRSEGCGVAVLKRLADARRDGDRVLALIRGTAVNQDGRSNGLTAPHGPAQEAVIRAALDDAGLGPADVGYLEAHGTGTALGDPIELGAIAAVMAGRAADRPLVVGSVKSNVGHGEGASGIAGLAKAVEVVRRGAIPGNLHFHTPTPRIEWDRIPLRVPTSLEGWPEAGPRRAGINSFGFGGTNAHAVLESCDEHQDLEREAPALLVLPISAPTREALRTLAGRLADHLEAHPEDALADVCATLGAGRNHWRERVAVIVGDRAALCDDLRAIAGGDAPPSAHFAPEDGADAELRVALLFTGQGAQAPGMARRLHAVLPQFRGAFDRACAALDRWLERPIAPVIFGEAGALIHETQFTQPGLFAVEWGIAAALRELGVEPRAVIGHSIGELTAAAFAGVLTLEDAARIVATRGRLMRSLPRGGAMASIEADEASILELLEDHLEAVDVAAINGPRQVVISGDEAAVEAILAELAGRGVRSRRLTVSHAFHSPRMEPILDAFEDELRRVTLRRPRVPMISNLTGRTAGADVARAGYWALHVRSPVRFADGVATLMATQRPGLLVEVGPAPVLAGLCAQNGAAAPAIAALRPGHDDAITFAGALARLWAHGAPIRWSALYGRRRRLALPPTPMHRVRHWIEASARGSIASAAGKPWIGARLDLAGPVIFESTIGDDARAWLDDHRVGARALVPFTGWVALARGAAIEAGAAGALAEVAVVAPLGVDEGASHRVQATIDGDHVRVDVRADEGWRRHCDAAIDRSPAPRGSLDLAAIAGRCPEARDAAAIYPRLTAAGLAYGPRFRGLVRAQVGEGEVLAELAAPAALAGDPRVVREIALLDAALQAAALLLEDAGGLHLPVGAEAIDVGELGERLFVHARARAGRGALRRVDLEVADEGGAVVARIRGLALQRVGGVAADDRALADEAWMIATTSITIPEATPTRALIVGDDPLGGALAGHLSEGTEIIKNDVHGGISAALARGRHATIVALTGLDGAPIVDAAALLRAAAARPGTRVVLVTRGAFVGEGEAVSAATFAQAGLWGLARSAAQELPTTPIRIVDLDPAYTLAEAAAALARELGDDPETQVVWRQGERLGLRLAPLVDGDDLPRPEGPSRLRVDRGGAGLRLEAWTPPTPGPGEVAIAVDFAGLNFRDVLGALGRYPGDLGPLGGECCGRIVALGDGVTTHAVGDRVIALAPGSFADVAITDARLAVPAPAGLSAEEAATIPIAFGTAWYALHELGRLRAGERALIHAAAGGVGMAALQIARTIGAEIFATASAPKWSTLRALGVDDPLGSRDTAFAAAIRERTGGEGIDVVLNSLTGEILRESLGLLRDGGRFLEMGKAELFTADEAAAINPRASYAAFDLAALDPDHLGAILRSVAAAFERGELRPLPHQVVPLARAPVAFRTMAAARHIGKIVLQAPRDLPLDPEGVYLVTGGTGGLGAQVARWLVDRGARRLLLAGRRAPAPELLAELTGAGAEVRAASVDLAAPGGARALVVEARRWGRLRGVVHAAGVVADAPLSGLDADAFARVLGPKAAAAWELSQETGDDPPHLFALFASASGVLGGAGQANYAAANAMLDALARGLRSAGRPALSIDWGPWRGEGMHGRLDPALQRRLAEQGIGALTPTRALLHLDRALRSAAAQAVIVPLDRPRLARRLAGGPTPPLLAGVVAAAADPGAPKGPADLRSSLAEAPANERHARLVASLRASAAQVLGARPSAIDPRRPLSDAGLDSLMAVDLLNGLSRALGAPLAPTLLLEHPSVDALARHLLGALELDRVDEGDDDDAAPAIDDATRRLRDELAALEDLMG